MCDEAAKMINFAAITAAMADGTGLRDSERNIRTAFLMGDCGRTCSDICGRTCGRRMKPVFAVYSSFLQRAYDQMIHDVALQNLSVMFAVDRAGLVGNDGETHQGIFLICLI